MTEPICYFCDRTFQLPGGVYVASPLTKKLNDPNVTKWHICRKCEERMLQIRQTGKWE